MLIRSQDKMTLTNMDLVTDLTIEERLKYEYSISYAIR